jgi:hypothetical protein
MRGSVEQAERVLLKALKERGEQRLWVKEGIAT